MNKSEKYHRKVRDFMLSLQTSENNYNTGEPQIRVSSLPFCPILHAFAGRTASIPYSSQFFFSVGTATHELIQNSASLLDGNKTKLWGNWRCTGCNELREHCLKPEKLCSCKAKGAMYDFTIQKQNRPFAQKGWLYSEVSIQSGRMSGHIDTILKVGKNAYVVVDYKSTSKETLMFHGDKLPYKKNVFQISYYSYALKAHYGINVVGWALVYFDRAKPIRNASDFTIRYCEWTKKNHEFMVKKDKWLQEAARVAKNARTALWNKDYSILPKLIALRPCKTKKKWENWMSAGFEMHKEECPMLKYCLAKAKLAKKLKILKQGDL